MNDTARRWTVLTLMACAVGCNTPSQPTAATSSQTLVPSASAPGPSASSAAMAPGERRRAMMAGICPVEVPGTTVSEQDAQGGAALVFGTTGDVLEVRSRVRAMAEMHNRRQGGLHPGMVHGHDGGMRMPWPDGGMRMPWPDGGMRMPWPDGGMMHADMMMGPPSEARAEDLERGAQLVLTATKPSDTDALRAHARKMAERMGQGHCFMRPAGESSAEEMPPRKP